MMKKRWKVVRFSPELFLEWITQDAEIHARCINGIPEGATFIRGWFDRYLYIAIIEHPDFEELEGWVEMADPPAEASFDPMFQTLEQ